MNAEANTMQDGKPWLCALERCMYLFAMLVLVQHTSRLPGEKQAACHHAHNIQSEREKIAMPALGCCCETYSTVEKDDQTISSGQTGADGKQSMLD